tara:strand:+ start:26027 stop:26215 length:189 start_codon:yes stop_codon:yes gene_type:complete
MAIVPAIPDKSVIRKYLISILLQAFNPDYVIECLLHISGLIDCGFSKLKLIGTIRVRASLTP